MLLDTFQILASAPVEAVGDEGAVGEILRKFHVSWPSFIAQWVNFIIICLLLKKFAYAPVLEKETDNDEVDQLGDKARPAHVELP